MVFSEELGYDPDEWEECPPPDHFLVFAPFTRLLLSVSAIGFAIFFFWLLDAHKNKSGSKKEEEEKVHLVAPTQSTPSASGDLLSAITGFFTGNGRAAADTDFVQRSFRDQERSPAAAAAAARQQDSKIDLRPDELSHSFHYKAPEEGPKTTANVRAELDQAAFELRDLLGDQSSKVGDQAPPVPPHRSALPDNQSIPDIVQQTKDMTGDAAQRAKEFLGEIHPPSLSGASDSIREAYEQGAQKAAAAFDSVALTTRDAFDSVAAPVADAFDQAGRAAHDAYDRAAAPVTDVYDRVAATTQDTLGRAGEVAHDAYDNLTASAVDAHDNVYNRAAEPLATAQQHATQMATAVKEAAGDAYDRVAAPVADALGRAPGTTRDAYDRVAAEAAQEAYERAAAAAADYPYDRVAQAKLEAAREARDRLVAPVKDGRVATTTQDATASFVDTYARAQRAAQDVYDREIAPAAAAAPQQAAAAAAAAAQRAADDASDAYGRAQAAAAQLVDPETARLEEDFERVQRDLDNLMAEHQVPLGVIIPGSSTSTSPAVSSSRPQHLQQETSPIDEHVRQLTAGLLTSDGGDEKRPSEHPSLHEIYEERQRQISPPMGSPVKIPTVEDRAALRHWEEELARKEQEKLSKLVDTIVGGDDISDIAASEGTEHLLPADRISMYSQDSATVQQLQPLQQQPRRGDEQEQLPASAKINQKIDQISSALEQSLLSEIEQLARQTSTMQAELARARDSDFSTDEVSEGAVHDHRGPDAFQPAGDVRFIPAIERPDKPAPISHRDSERQSGESDDFVKITPPSHSGAPSPSPALVCMSSSEEEQLKALVEEYDVIGTSSSSGGTLKKDASAPAALSVIAAAAAAPAVAHHQKEQSLPSPTTAALLQDYETVQAPFTELQKQHHPQQQQQQASPLSAYYTDSPLHQQQPGAEAALSAEEQAQLDQVLRDFEMTPGAGRKDLHNKSLPKTPTHTPEDTLMDPFGRPIQGLPEMAGESSVTYMMDGEPMSPTTEIRLPLAPRGSIGELKMQFPRLPSEVGIEVVDPAHANLPKNAFLPSDLEDVLASLVNVDATELFLPSQQPPDEAAAAAAHVAAAQAEMQQQQKETPILSGATPEPIKKESPDALFGERKPTVVEVRAAAPPHAAVQQLLQQQASLDLSQPLQQPMAAFDRPADGAKPTAAPAVNADFVVRQQPGNEEVPYAEFSVKPQMMPAFSIKKPSASTTVPHEELEKADAIFQDALDYMQKQPSSKESQPHQQATGFIMEEEMLSSHGENAPRRLEKSADGTSKLIKTNEIFERLDPHDDHDDMTYAPEIQSVEIPPDQMSETSELPHEDLPIDDVPLFKSPEAQKLEAEIRAQESAMDEAKSAMQHRAALAQAPHIISMNSKHPRFPSTPSISSAKDSPKALRKQSSLLSILGVTSTQEMLLKIDSLEALSNAMRKAGLDSTNVIFGIDYTASNKYQGEESFGGHSLHTIHPNLKNPYQQVITILGRTLAPFTTTGDIPVFGFGDAKTSDWSVFSLKEGGHCTTLEEVLKTYNEVTPTVELSGPTNFSPLIYQAIEICQRTREYHILVIIADGQVTNEKATRRAIVQACQYPLSIIVVGVGDGPWDMMRVFDESLPKRPWDNFHFVEFHEVVKRASGAADGDVKVAIQSLLEIPDQYRCICNLGLLKGRSPSIAHKNN